MAKWQIKGENTLSAEIKYDDHGSYMKVDQDETPYLDMVKQERETHKRNKGHIRKFATIPDIVSIELLEKWGLDIHSPEFMHDPDGLKKLKYLMITEYPHLVVGT